MDAAESSQRSEMEAVVKALRQQLPKETLGDLQCPQCGSMLNDPWTLGSGRTVCAACVTRVAGEHVPPVSNRLLDAIVKQCLPQSADAAARRLDGNENFKKGEWQKAVDAYTSALQLDDTSSAAYANRSIAQLKLKLCAEAIEDATRAVALRPFWAKWHLRLSAALRADGQHADALKPLLRAFALDKSVAKTEILELLQAGNELPAIEELSFPSPPSCRQIPAASVSSLRDDFDCCLCSAIFCEPTVLPCGHCICRDCAARLLDHALQTAPSCPLCRLNLIPLLRQINLRARDEQRTGLRFSHGGAQLTVCSQLERLLKNWFPEEYAARLTEIRTPQNEWVPIFVCSLSAPFIPTPLHIFEPRYRLMMRRALESNQRFGMCLPSEDGSFADTGTMLFIDRFEQLPDGRSMVGTKGVSRFSVVERGTLDGYSTALIRPYEEDAQGFPESTKFHREALALHRGACALFSFLQRSQPHVTGKIEHQLGPLPDVDSPQFDAHMSFYAAQILQTLTGCEDAEELVFAQPEERRWQLLLKECAEFKPFGDALKLLGDAEDSQENAAMDENDDSTEEENDEKQQDVATSAEIEAESDGPEGRIRSI